MLKSYQLNLHNVFFVLILCLSFSPLYTEESQHKVQEIEALSHGLTLLKKSSIDFSVDAWLKSSIREDDKVFKKKIIQQFNGYQKIYGRYQDFRVIEALELTAKNKIFYLTLNLENGPLYAVFNTYKTRRKWVINSIEFSDHINILPMGLIYHLRHEKDS